MNSLYPVRIMRVITWLPWGGIEKRMVEVLKRLDRNKFSPLVCCLRNKKGVYEGELRDSGIKVVKLNFRSRHDLKGIWQLSRLMRKEGVRIVHSHMYRANIPSLIAAKMARVPVKIAQVHNLEDWKGRREWFMERLFFPLADRIVCVSRAVMDYERRFLKLPEEKFSLLYNGIDMGEFKVISEKGLKESLGIPREAKVVGMVARLHPDKGQDILIEAARKITEVFPNTYFLLLGNGGYKVVLRRRIREYGLEDRFILTGGVKDVRAYYSIMDISVLPSRIEGFSNVILESMAFSLPVIATNTGGNPEAIADGQTGFLIPYGEPEALSEKVVHLLKEEKLRKKMGERAYEVVKNFSLERMVEETEKLYLSLLSERGF